MDGSQRLHGVSGDGHLLAFQSDALDLTELRLSLVIRCNGDGLFVDSDTLNLTELGKGFVRRRDSNGLGVDGHTPDTLQGLQSLHGISRDGHCLVVDSDALNLTQLGQGFVCRRDGDRLGVNGDAVKIDELPFQFLNLLVIDGDIHLQLLFERTRTEEFPLCLLLV